jgi:hypothetical protein
MLHNVTDISERQRVLDVPSVGLVTERIITVAIKDGASFDISLFFAQEVEDE